MGEIEAGVRESLSREGIKNPSTAPELLAIELAKRLDNGVDDRSLAGISRELRLTLEEVRVQPRPATDEVSELIGRQ